MSEKYKDDFNFFWKKINSGENFSFVRFADGEVMLMNGLTVNETTQAYLWDKWYSKGGETKLGIDLKDCLSVNDQNFYFAISSKTDNIDDYNFLYNNIENKNKLTFANLWINSNYKNTITNIKNLSRDVILICNENCNIQNIPFKVIEFIPFPDDCVNFWEKNKNYFNEKIQKISTKYNNKLFIVCCGPTSAVIIKNMFNNNKNNTYVDFGSSLDVFIHGKKTRPYMEDDSMYHNHISKF
jgi:hypothetical protein